MAIFFELSVEPSFATKISTLTERTCRGILLITLASLFSSLNTGIITNAFCFVFMVILKTSLTIRCIQYFPDQMVSLINTLQLPMVLSLLVETNFSQLVVMHHRY